jgi:hypothetical protein
MRGLAPAAKPILLTAPASIPGRRDKLVARTLENQFMSPTAGVSLFLGAVSSGDGRLPNGQTSWGKSLANLEDTRGKHNNGPSVLQPKERIFRR